MGRMLSNLYFLLFSSFYFTVVFTGGLPSLITEAKENMISYMERVDVEKGAVLTESTYKRALPNKEYIDARVSFNKGEYINKSFIRERLGEQPTLVGEQPPALNKGRDSP